MNLRNNAVQTKPNKKMSLSPIIEVTELLIIYRNPGVLIFDAGSGKNARSNYEAEHLEGAFFVDLDTQLAAIRSDAANGGRHPLPAIAVFAETLTALGISKHDHIIIYDDKHGSNAAARFWWMLRSAGHEKVQVLNGGLQQAKKLHFPLSSKTEQVKLAAAPYQADRWILPMVEMNEVEKMSQDTDHLVIDVRDPQRYAGITEPIDLVAGHIPGAINIPFTENMNEEGMFLAPGELKNKYEKKFGAVRAGNIIVHCGSGVTACHTLLAMTYAGIATPALYVGSWSEWSRNHKKIETSAN
ncbi:MAG: sulfurtransferase [Ferruginibacter sp.]